MAEEKKPAPPINVSKGAGKIKVIVSGGMKVTSNDQRIAVERKT